MSSSDNNCADVTPPSTKPIVVRRPVLPVDNRVKHPRSGDPFSVNGNRKRSLNSLKQKEGLQDVILKGSVTIEQEPIESIQEPP